MFPTKTVTQAIADVYLRATGKAGGVDIASTKGIKILAFLNHFSEEWSESDWESMASTFIVPAAVSATDTYDMSSLTTLHHLSQQEGDFIRIYHTDGVGETDYTIVKYNKLYDDGHQRNASGNRTVAIQGKNLIFSRAFVATDPQFGGSIRARGYLRATVLVSGTDVLQVDNPKWLTDRCASEYVRNDVTRQQFFDTLMGEAGVEWAKMKKNNIRQQDEVYRGAWSASGASW
jgi:hypothetical protein